MKYIRNSYFNKDKHLNDNGIALCADALKLNREDSLPNEVRDHLNNCFICKKEIVNFIDVFLNLDIEDSSSHPFFKQDKTSGFSPKTKRNLNTFFLPLAAALLIGISLIVIYFWQPPHQISQQYSSANFQENPELENLITDIYRSQEIEIISPAIGEKVSIPIKFEWRGYEADKYYIKILNNRDEVLHTFISEKSSVTFSETLTHGLYYWKLESEDDMLFVGKFIII